MSASVKRQMQRGYFPDARPGAVVAVDPPTPTWAKGRRSIAEMMETNDVMSPIAGEKGGAMEVDVRRAVGEGVVKRLRSLESPPRFDDQYPISEYDEGADEHSEDARGKVACDKNLGSA
ncbi:hypothetical protein Pmar_PMAR016094 [Perkinsus marinus ATCC 50983]|uniref:Uncharacterized protein n=1 Tax=Perkinsus marinus (strain ATCC 50983 / TXsc) TaxID=423536 RepID=C5LZ08_PERM5|nr:hypothetical protein Pmar_PMAR016094 [Perkinsus marinus ATCC 50983]EEQ98017.1 hypothetical protein Pmar_PMAR016094 [Perkinsus marinus ATCC 50983]|eukprot:XP_002765300.1 hypothetical protein Pmar_PMAR016094 [Perkinsus marinus ATCC 50983]